MNEAVEAIQNASSTEINIIYGTTINQDIQDEIIVTVIAAGFDETRSVEFSDIGSTPHDETQIAIDEEKVETSSKKSRKKRSKETEKVEEEPPSKTAIPSWLKSRFK